MSECYVCDLDTIIQDIVHFADTASGQFYETTGYAILSIKTFQYVILIVICVYSYWYLFIKPFDLYRDFSAYGFENVTKDRQGNDALRKNAINELRHRRKIGELPPSYPNGWFTIFESDSLMQGKVKEVDVLGLNLVAWRGESGQPYVADAYCPHIGAHLGVGGKVSGECIQCPFHSWTFDGDADGKLKEIPYSSTVPDFIKLKMWRIMETNGFVFLWYHAENEEPTWYPDRIAEIDNEEWTYRGRSEFRIACHIQEIPENGADVAHLNVLHVSSFFSGTNPGASWFSWDSIVKHVWSAVWVPNPDPQRGYEALLKVVHHIKLLNWIPCFYINVDIRQAGPGIVIMNFDTVFGKGVLIQTVTPIEPLLQRVTHRFYTSSTFIHPLGKLVLYGEAKQIARDIRIWNRKCFMKKPMLTKEDQPIKTFRRWFLQFYSENSPRHYFSNGDANANKLTF